MYEKLVEELSNARVRLVAVSKTKPNEQIMHFYDLGQRDFGENKVQDLVKKEASLPKDIRWHFIGHLQTNKVKYIAPFVHLIHAVDNMKLLREIDKQARRHNRIIPCLLQIKIASEATKFGMSLDDAREILRSDEFQQFHNITIAGVMGMATFTMDEIQIRTEFSALREAFNALKEEFFAEDAAFKERSMGMTDDWEIAVEEGSTMVRIGRSLFGERV